MSSMTADAETVKKNVVWFIMAAYLAKHNV